MKYTILINCVLLQNLPFFMCNSVSKVSRTPDNGVICETSGAIESATQVTGFATVAGTKRKNATDEIRNEHSIHKISVIGNKNDISSNLFKRQVNKDANYVSGNQGKPNGTTAKPLTKIFSLLDSILSLHSGVEQTNLETNATQKESELNPINDVHTNSSDLNGVWDDVFKVVTFKISRDSFSKLFFPDDSSTKSNVSDKYVSIANSEVKTEKTGHPKEIKKERISRTKISEERLAKEKEYIVQSKFDKSDETKNYDKKNITGILKYMTKLIAEHSGGTRYHRLPTTTSSPLDMDEILKQMQQLIDIQLETTPNSGSNNLIKLETPARRGHKDMQTIIKEMDKLLKLGEVESSKVSSSSRTDLRRIFDQMEEAIKEQKRFRRTAEVSRHSRNRERRSLKERNHKNHLNRFRLLLPNTKNGNSLSFKEPSEDLCTSPFIDVAYKVCILPVLDRQLSWHDAHKYCRQRGLDLAMDSGVIKGRKYFNNQLGLIGTRERWTLWVGGRKNEQGKWLWNDGTTLPNFFWSKNQPRVYGQDSTPAGTCMAIHGFAEYYGTALPCHNRRRFICQKI